METYTRVSSHIQHIQQKECICSNGASIGVYLGIDVAIKEVLPSKDYDVAKYFEREWRLMKYVQESIINPRTRPVIPI